MSVWSWMWLSAIAVPCSNPHDMRHHMVVPAHYKILWVCCESLTAWSAPKVECCHTLHLCQRRDECCLPIVCWRCGPIANLSSYSLFVEQECLLDELGLAAGLFGQWCVIVCKPAWMRSCCYCCCNCLHQLLPVLVHCTCWQCRSYTRVR